MQISQKPFALNIGIFFLFVGLCNFLSVSSAFAENTFEQWLDQEFVSSQKYLQNNISPLGSVPGTVVASPSKFKPDYYSHWVRDSSLVMLTIERLMDKTDSQVLKELLAHQLFDFAHLTRFQQQQNSEGGLGEVKFYIDGTAFTGPWGRPQNDGPALRAMSMIKLSHYLLNQGREDFVRQSLYDGKLHGQSIVKKDLEYVAHNWQNRCFDLWEEVNGHHFFTRLIQRRALIEGAELALRLGDKGAADYYLMQSEFLASAVLEHWDAKKGYFSATLNPSDSRGKGGLDSSIFIAIVNAYKTGDLFLPLFDEKILSNAQMIKETFGRIYGINSNKDQLAPLIGRYPEDTYNGYDINSLGNPWFINTLDFASFHYKLARTLKKVDSITVTSLNQKFLQGIMVRHFFPRFVEVGENLSLQNEGLKLIIAGSIAEGDNYLKRIQEYVGPNGEMSEQINRETGKMQGAVHLTWSYAAFINAYINRFEAIK